MSMVQNQLIKRQISIEFSFVFNVNSRKFLLRTIMCSVYLLSMNFVSSSSGFYLLTNCRDKSNSSHIENFDHHNHIPISVSNIERFNSANFMAFWIILKRDVKPQNSKLNLFLKKCSIDHQRCINIYSSQSEYIQI